MYMIELYFDFYIYFRNSPIIESNTCSYFSQVAIPLSQLDNRQIFSVPKHGWRNWKM